MYFELRIDSNEEWQAYFIPTEYPGENILESLTEGKRLQVSNPLSFFLKNIYSDKKERTQLPFLSDAIHWSDDITLGAFLPERGTFLIVSEQLKDILKKFEIPSHAFYPIRICELDNRSNCKAYYLLQIFGSLYDITDLSQSEFHRFDRQSKALLSIEKGSYKTAAEFAADKIQLLKKGIRLEMVGRKLTRQYDVLWSYSNSLMITNRVKSAIEDQNMRGLTFKPFSDFTVL